MYMFACPTAKADLGGSSLKVYLKSPGMSYKKLTVCGCHNIDVEATNTHLKQLPANR